MKWHHVEMGKVANVVSGYGFPREYQGLTDEEFPFFKVGDMNLPGNEKCMTTIANTISGATLKKLKAKAFPQGTIIFPKIGAAIATNKKRVLTQPSVVDNNVMGLIPKSHISSWYLYYWMLQFDLRSVSNIGPVPSMRKTEVERVSLPLPPPSEQRRIVEILDQADALSKKRAQADAKAVRILSSLFYKVFGDPATNPKGWPRVPFSELVDIGTHLVDPNQDEYLDLPHIGGEQIEGGTGRILDYKLVRESNLRSGKFVFTEEHVLYSKIRPYLNKVAFPRFSGVCSADIYPLLPKDNRISPWYIVALLQSHAFLAYAAIHSERLRMPKLNQDQLGAFATPIPDANLVVDFDRYASDIDSTLQLITAQSEKVETLFAVLLHRAFIGDLTTKWREAHMKEILAEMEAQTKALNVRVES